MKLLLRVALASAVCFFGCRATYRAVTAPVRVFHHEKPPAPTTDVTNPGMPVAPAPSPGPRVVERRTTEPTSSPQTLPRAQTAAVHFPTAKPVPNKPGYVFSPSDPSKYVDVTGYPSGSKVKDPYSGRIFLVP